MVSRWSIFMNRVIKGIDYHVTATTISLHFALNYNEIEQIRKETKLTPRYLHSVDGKDTGPSFKLKKNTIGCVLKLWRSRQMNSSSLSSSSRNSICLWGGKTTKKQVSSVLLPLVVLPYHSHYRNEGFLSLFSISIVCEVLQEASVTFLCWTSQY